MERWMEAIFGENGIERAVNGVVWGVPAMVLILGTGLLLTVLCGFPQYRHFGHIMRNTLGKALNKSDAQSGAVSPF